MQNVKKINNNVLIFHLMLIIKKTIIKPINVLIKAALSPDKKISIVQSATIKILILFNFFSFLKYIAVHIINGNNLDK